MAKPKIYVTRQIFDEAVDRLKEATDMKYWDSEMPPSQGRASSGSPGHRRAVLSADRED